MRYCKIASHYIYVCLSSESQDRKGPEAEARTDINPGVRDATERVSDTVRESNGLNVTNARLKAYGRKLGLFIPKVNYLTEAPRAIHS